MPRPRLRFVLVPFQLDWADVPGRGEPAASGAGIPLIGREQVERRYRESGDPRRSAKT
jgi:hypothetical protein